LSLSETTSELIVHKVRITNRRTFKQANMLQSKDPSITYNRSPAAVSMLPSKD